MEERKFVKLKKNEFKIKEFLKKDLGKGKVSEIVIEYTPVGEKIILTTNRPGLIIGRKGENINRLTEILKKKYEFENPHIEIQEIISPDLDPQLIADDIAFNIEKRGALKFKIVAYRTLKRIVDAGALGVELRLSGKLPSDRARTWRFTQGYLKKTGDTAKIVKKASAVAQTKTGTVGVQVSILPPDAVIHDQINVNDELKSKIRMNIIEEVTEKKEKNKKIENKKLK